MILKKLKSISSEFNYNLKKNDKKGFITHNKVTHDIKNRLLNSLKENKEISFILNYINLITPTSYFAHN